MYDYLLLLALIMLSTKIFGLITEKVHLPQVVGALIAGIVLGPSCIGILHETDFLVKTSEIGVIMLMFIAGLDTDIEELKKTGFMSFIIALMGVFVPLIVCAAVHYLFYGGMPNSIGLIESVFVGVIFSATSVSITVETLNEMGKLKSRIGTTIIGAALIDDIIGIVILSVVTGFGGSGSNPAMVVVKILEFFVFTGIVGFITYKIFKMLDHDHAQSRRVAVWGLAFCFLLSYAAETFFGVADITGAYFAGVILCNITKTRKELARKMTVASYIIFSPVFFASVGIKTDISGVTTEILLFAVVLLAAAVLTKIIGCSFAAKICGLNKNEALSVGVGMVARGEVALMVAQKGINAGLIDGKIFPAIVLVVVGAALVTPILLKLVMSGKNESTAVETA